MRRAKKSQRPLYPLGRERERERERKVEEVAQVQEHLTVEESAAQRKKRNVSLRMESSLKPLLSGGVLRFVLGRDV